MSRSVQPWRIAGLGMVMVLTLGAGTVLAEGIRPSESEHVVVYYEKGRFGGWPANHGIWSWGDEILVGFSRGYYKDLGDRHHIDREKPEEHLLARSLDGGQSWAIENPVEHGYLIPEGAALHGTELPDFPPKPALDSPGGINFTHPDFAMTLRMADIHVGPSRFYYSYDRGKTWAGPFRVPDFGTPGIAARTDYLVDGPDSCTVFLTAGKTNRREGRPLAARTTDGGKTWNFLGWIGPEPEGFSIMPASVRLSENEILVTVRRHEGERRWIAAYLSRDNGTTWEHLNDPVESTGVGNPPSLIKLQDGRLCLTYGYRAGPYSIRAKLSADNGRTWSDEYILRDDGCSRDIGYPRTVQRPDGAVVTVYYFCDPTTGPERYIAATIWRP